MWYEEEFGGECWDWLLSLVGMMLMDNPTVDGGCGTAFVMVVGSVV